MITKKYKILITGGAGFIGSNLVDHFLSLGHKIVCLDDLSTGFEKNISHSFSPTSKQLCKFSSLNFHEFIALAINGKIFFLKYHSIYLPPNFLKFSESII